MTSWTPGALRKRPTPPRCGSWPHGHPSSVDEYIESWVCWREACEDVGSAYERWVRASFGQRALAYQSYRAALEREEQAALVHAIWTDRLAVRER